MKNNTQLTFVSTVLTGSLIASIVMMVFMHKLPGQIQQAINSSHIYDQVKPAQPVTYSDSIRIVTASIPAKGSFVYFEGKVKQEGARMSDEYTWEVNDNYPMEIWDGYIHLVQANSGSKYFMWSEHKLHKTGAVINGWFLTDGGKFQTSKGGKDYIQMIFPIVQRKRDIK